MIAPPLGAQLVALEVQVTVLLVKTLLVTIRVPALRIAPP
jgi:hypothetical protein